MRLSRARLLGQGWAGFWAVLKERNKGAASRCIPSLRGGGHWCSKEFAGNTGECLDAENEGGRELRGDGLKGSRSDEIKLSKGKLPECSSSKLFNKLPGELVDVQSLQ